MKLKSGHALLLLILLNFACAHAASAKPVRQGGSTEFNPALEELNSASDQVIFAESKLISKYSAGVDAALMQIDPLSDYETFIPRSTQPQISRGEKRLVKAYLDNIDNAGLAQLLALYHLSRSLLRYSDGDAVKHTILAQYFLRRSQDLGSDRRWIRDSLQATEVRLQLLSFFRSFTNDAQANADEYHPAHEYFRETFFNNHEGNRFIALEKLLDDYFEHPENTLTNTYLTTVNIWMGGEANYDDPTILYHFVMSSYFSVRARDLAEQREILWRQNPATNTRFRLATLIGGWTVPARRWLAKLQGDVAAVASLDNEHNQWLAINTAFTSVPVGLMLFPENDRFDEGFAGWEAGRNYCDKVSPTDLSCINWPRASFNILSFILSEADFFLKKGDVATARTLLSLRNLPIPIFAESFAVWDLGREAWEHREQNAEKIAALYQNDNPADDPTNFLLKKHQWGPQAIVCQVCHQRQSKQWPEGEVERVLTQTDEIPPIGEGNWPAVSTTWYGSSKVY